MFARSVLDAPGRMAAVFAGVIDADGVARRIAQPRFAPKPALIRGFAFDSDAGALQACDFAVHVLHFEVELRRVLLWDGAVNNVQRERGFARRQFEACVVRAPNDQLQPEQTLERYRLAEVDGGGGD